uniref:Di-copper centre-containing protein n=1 Tax=Mycena chlorophos TaxID=658473 RepID=A0ABQ0M8A7_MYCCL|nr:di-copper centre-containing protein [Mycena chlorophos]
MARVFVLLLSLLHVISFANAAATVHPPAHGPGATCKNPAVRKEWRSLTKTEQKNWINAVTCLAKKPHRPSLAPTVPIAESLIPPINPNSSAYDDWAYVHMIRFTGLFFPWHRWLLSAFETDLKENCGFQGTQPYWDWSLDAKNVAKSPLFTNFDKETGLGGWGDPANDYAVHTGAFSNTSGFKFAYPSPHTLRRNLTMQPFLGNTVFLTDPAQRALYVNETFTPAQVHKMVNGFVGDYKGLQTYIEGFNGTHQGVHLMLGGDLGGNCPANAVVPAQCQNNNPTYATNEPMFWMHHAMVDKIWADWQANNKHNGKSYFGGSVESLKNVSYFNEFPTGAPPNYLVNDTMPADGLFPDPTISSMLSTTEGPLCYVYE